MDVYQTELKKKGSHSPAIVWSSDEYPYLKAKIVYVNFTMEAVNKTHWSEENSVDLIQKLRNDLLKDFLDERFLKEYIAHQFNIRELSNIKVEFIKKDLKELFAAAN